jgi:hypothetical protein
MAMRVYYRMLAVATDAGAAKGFRSAPSALLPPIPLYRTILRTHRKRLNVEQRVLGDMYVKAEFKAHRDIDNPVQIVGTSPCTYCCVLTCLRLDFSLSGRCTPKLSRATLGKVTGWTKQRLTR